VESLELPAGSNVKLQHGQGYHIMLLGLKKPLTAGDKFPMTLQFEKAGKLKIIVYVEEKSAQHGAEHHH
jgi:copper(I)-binding protein